MKRYEPKVIEPKWQKKWQEDGTYVANLDSTKPKYFAMSMFNYPSGAGIHIGHAMNYTISDVKARFKRQSGYESYHPVGWDAFGLPAENYAIKAGVSPQESMDTIIPSYHKQYQAMGWSNDWTKEIATHLPEYYKWTQWIFAEMYKQGMAYQDSRMQWWCEKCQTVLANEQIIDGKCWRHDGPDDPEVKQKEVKQWFFKITEYADELLEAIDDLDWTESVKLAQKNWIGRSKGAEIDFAIDGSSENIKVFTTRPDTIFGATFLVLAPEHDLVEKLTTNDQKTEVDDYIKTTQKKTELDRISAKEKTGVFTGSYAVNPANQEKIPIWVADYVLTGYGTGAIMAVPAHDERDYEFAEKYGLAIMPVIGAVYFDEQSPAKKDENFVSRSASQVIIKHPEEEKYLILKKLGWEEGFYGFVIGGIEDGESAIETAKREILEETGFTDYPEPESLGMPYFAELYHQTKGYNLRVKMNTFFVKLNSLDADEVSEEEKSINEVLWISAEEILDKVHGEGARKVFEEYLGKKQPEMVFEGRLLNSRKYDEVESFVAREKIVEDLTKMGVATEKINYKMRDWSVSRQRYWGAPIPIIYCEKCGPILDENLPVELPILKDFQPSGDGRSALGRATDWLNVDCPKCGGKGQRETDTLDTYICSSWYFLRYLDPKNDKQAFGKEVANKWMPVDFYNGGDHATAHMLYARFITRFFSKMGLVNNPEPFKQFLFNGKVRASDGTAFSKSKGNGVDPLEIISQGYGADALRTYLMFAAPLEFNANWDPQGVPGAYRFINRLYTLVQEYLETDDVELTDQQAKNILKSAHLMIKKTSEDIEANRYNTAISALMKCVNDLYKLKTTQFGRSEAWEEALNALVACVAPFAPHVADELWSDLGHENSVQKDSWPVHKEQYLAGDTIKIVVQVNGKLRATIEVNPGNSEEQIKELALSGEKIQKFLANKKPAKIIYVPGRLVNIVA